MNASVLIVTQKETFFAVTLVAPHDVGAGVLAAAIVLQTFIHIWRERGIEIGFLGYFQSPTQPGASAAPAKQRQGPSCPYITETLQAKAKGACGWFTQPPWVHGSRTHLVKLREQTQKPMNTFNF